MVAHHRIGRHVDGEHRGQLTDAGFDPAAAVLEALATDMPKYFAHQRNSPRCLQAAGAFICTAYPFG